MTTTARRANSRILDVLKTQLDVFKQNLLKSIGFMYVAIACSEYFTNHFFGCSLTASLLLAYGAYRAYRKCEQIQKAPLFAGTNDDFDANLCLLVASGSAVLFAFLAVMSAPPDVKAFFGH